MSERGEGRIERSDVEAVLATRHELGSTYEPALVDSFAERIEQAVEARAAQRSEVIAWRDQQAAAAGKRQLTLGIVSLGAGIPITAISAALTDLPGLAVAWLGIAAVNAAHAAAVNGSRRRDST